MVKDLERNFPSTGISNSSTKEVVTGKHNPTVEVESTDRGKRKATAEATEEAKKKEGPAKKAGKKASGCETKKTEESLLPLLL